METYVRPQLEAEDRIALTLGRLLMATERQGDEIARQQQLLEIQTAKMEELRAAAAGAAPVAAPEPAAAAAEPAAAAAAPEPAPTTKPAAARARRGAR